MGTVSFGVGTRLASVTVACDVTGAPDLPMVEGAREWILIPTEIEVVYVDHGAGWSVSGLRILGKRRGASRFPLAVLASFPEASLSDAPEWARRFAESQMPEVSL